MTRPAPTAPAVASPRAVRVRALIGAVACLGLGIGLQLLDRSVAIDLLGSVLYVLLAGLLVLLGVLLGWLVHPVFFGLSAFVGAGLVFAGLTDTCGMGMLLVRMPWNQVRESAAGCCGR